MIPKWTNRALNQGFWGCWLITRLLGERIFQTSHDYAETFTEILLGALQETVWFYYRNWKWCSPIYGQQEKKHTKPMPSQHPGCKIQELSTLSLNNSTIPFTWSQHNSNDKHPFLVAPASRRCRFTSSSWDTGSPAFRDCASMAPKMCHRPARYWQ